MQAGENIIRKQKEKNVSLQLPTCSFFLQKKRMRTTHLVHNDNNRDAEVVREHALVQREDLVVLGGRGAILVELCRLELLHISHDWFVLVGGGLGRDGLKRAARPSKCFKCKEKPRDHSADLNIVTGR